MLRRRRGGERVPRPLHQHLPSGLSAHKPLAARSAAITAVGSRAGHPASRPVHLTFALVFPQEKTGKKQAEIQKKRPKTYDRLYQLWEEDVFDWLLFISNHRTSYR